MRKYQIRKNILKALKEYSGTPCNAEGVIDHPAFMLLKPSLEEIKTEWKQLEGFGYIAPREGFGGEYCLITEKGLQQVSPDFKKEAFVHGPHVA
jgi:hypothetical protein